MRNHGFQSPYNPMQVCTWIMLPLLIAQFGAFITPVYPIIPSTIISIIYIICALLSTYFGYKCCITDPVDQRIMNEPGPHSHASPTSTGSNPDTKFCWVCEARVGTLSMHCKFCNKCVDHFDHHCQWLNTCVGASNYQYFFRAVYSTFFFVFVHFIASAFVIVAYFLRIDLDEEGESEGLWGFKKRADSLYGLAEGAVIYTIIGFGVITLASSLLVGQLWFFHINLKKEKITTYAYIVRDNARRREKDRKLLSIRRERIREKARAKREGRTYDHFRLTVGEYVRGCDPYCCITCDPLSDLEKKDEKAKKEESNKPEVQLTGKSEGENKSDILDLRRNNQELSLQEKKSSENVEQRTESNKREDEPMMRTLISDQSNAGIEASFVPFDTDNSDEGQIQSSTSPCLSETV